MTRVTRGTRLRRAVAGCLLTPGLILGSGAAARAQGLPDLQSLKPSSSPAFLILGVAPSAISRPNNPADLGLALVNASNRLSEIPRDFAVEFSPYWLQNRQSLTWRDDIHRSMDQSFWRTLAISAGTHQVASDSTRTALAVGGRALLFSGRVSAESVHQLEARETELARISTIGFRLTGPERQRIDSLKIAALREALTPIPPGDQRRRQAVADSIGQVYEVMLRRANEQVLADSTQVKDLQGELDALEELVIVREGPKLEVASAASWMTDQQTGSGKLDRLGLWATYSCDNCRFVNNSPSRIAPIVLARFLHDVEEKDTDLFDLGARLAMDGKGYTFSVEGVRRAFMGDSVRSALWRFAGILEYELAENSWLLASFGRDNNSPAGGDLFARFGVKVNFIRDRYSPVNGMPGM